MDYVTNRNKFDELVSQDGVEVLVDSKALFTLIGSTMDFETDQLSSRFTFKNPNIKEMCGCGESFMV
jgi:iron-sulfur cluster assembly accessory protein